MVCRDIRPTRLVPILSDRDTRPIASGAPRLQCKRMTKRALFFAYGLTAYIIFLGTFLYAIAFVGGFFVPTRLDGVPRGPLAQSLAIDAGLLAIFAVQHSVMARRWFKERWTRIVPVPIAPSTYVLFAALALRFLLCPS